MFLDPDKLNEVSPADILEEAARGHLGLDHRFLHALVDRQQAALPAVAAFANRERGEDVVDLAPELLALLSYWKAPEAIPFLISIIKENPEQVPDEATEALVALGKPALEPLLALSAEIDDSEAGEIAFILANIRIRDDRVLQILTKRLEFDLSDALLLLGIYGDPAAIPVIEKAGEGLGPGDIEAKKEIAETLENLRNSQSTGAEEPEAFDLWSLYPETDDPPLDLLNDDERTELLSHPTASVRSAAAQWLFNQELAPEQRKKILELAQHDPSVTVRARAWEALINSTEQIEVVEAMLAALRNPQLAMEELGGLVVGLAPEADRNEVRQAITNLYQRPEGRAKALEAMWRSMHPSFRENFAAHLGDADLEVQRGAIWGVGYYGLKGEIDRLRRFFSNEELRADALFAYSLVIPADLSRGRMKGLLARIEKDAKGLSESEEELVKTALDERLVLAGKEPVFIAQED
ncbi:MAG: hypothetical protein JO210_16820 [Acidobacteriaceae bacterium]|nr:hypothetical protein [Acidobacteriaceae bacterium]